MCDICGDEKKACDVIGIFPPDMIAMMTTHTQCRICEGYGTYTLPHFHNPRPCPVCQGVGQMNVKLLPSTETIALMLMHVFPPRVAPSWPVPEGKKCE
jgi:hypothetical protein